MSDAFPRALRIVLGEEGGEANIKGDRGGHTFRGITQRTYSSWRKACNEPDQDVICMADAELETLYRVRYWNPSHAGELPEALACMQFDAAVNHGPANAVRLLQEALGFGQYDVDGRWGPQTIDAVNACDPVGTFMAYLTVRDDFYCQIVANDATQTKFLKGWRNRLANLKTELA